MSKILPQRFDAEHSGRLARADVLLRNEPDEEEDEEEKEDEDEDEGDVTNDEGNDDEEDGGGYSVGMYRWCQKGIMNRDGFINVAEEVLDSLPEEFRSRIQNVAILIENFPPNQSPPRPGQQRRLLLGIFHAFVGLIRMRPGLMISRN